MRVDGHHAPDSPCCESAAVASGRGQSSSSAGTSPPRRTSATRSRRLRAGAHRDPAAWRPFSPLREVSLALPTPRPARSARSRSSRITGHASRPPASPPSSRSAREPIHIRTPRKSPNQKRRQGARLRPPQVRATSCTGRRDRRRLSAWPRSRDLPAALQRRSDRTKRARCAAPSKSTSKRSTTTRPSSQPSPNPCHFRDAGHPSQRSARRFARRFRARDNAPLPGSSIARSPLQ